MLGSGFSLSHLVGIGIPVACADALNAQEGQPEENHVPREKGLTPKESTYATVVGEDKKDAAGKKEGQTAQVTSKFRVLALHGTHQSADIFDGKVKAVTKQVKALAEFVFVDGPFAAPGEQDIKQSGKLLSWLDYAAEDFCATTSFNQIMDQIEEFKCDGVVGFSEGAAVLASLLFHPEHASKLRSQLRFVGFFSGFIPRESCWNSWMQCADSVSGLPSFHCIGRTDNTIVPERSEALMARFTGATSFYHDGGHVVPAQVRQDFKAFLQHLSA